MKQVFDQLLKFLQQGIAAIFHFAELIWTWSVDQITKLAAVPWQEWPLLKQILLVLILAGVLWALYRAGRELLEAGAAILAAFAGLLGGTTARLNAQPVSGHSDAAASAGVLLSQTTPDVPKHSCKGKNDCKGQGGGKHPGKNSCKGKGDCATDGSKAPKAV